MPPNDSGHRLTSIWFDQLALVGAPAMHEQAHAQVNWAGRTSMEVGVEVVAEPWNQSGHVAKQVASAYLVFVAVDADGQPQPIPPVLPASDEDKRRFREAQIRRQSRLARRDAILASRER